MAGAGFAKGADHGEHREQVCVGGLGETPSGIHERASVDVRPPPALKLKAFIHFHLEQTKSCRFK